MPIYNYCSLYIHKYYSIYVYISIPFRQVFFMYSGAVFSANTAKLPLASRAARESGRTFMWGLPPPHPTADDAHISGCVSRKTTVPLLRGWTATHPHLGHCRFSSVLPHGHDGHSQRVCHPLNPAYIVGIKMPTGTLERGRHGTAQQVLCAVPMLSYWMLCQCGWTCMSIYTYIFMYLYK